MGFLANLVERRLAFLIEMNVLKFIRVLVCICSIPFY